MNIIHFLSVFRLNDTVVRDNRIERTPCQMIHQEALNRKSILLQKGVKEFHYGLEKSVFARTQKNADKKAKAKGWI